jgi:hypothetical protein
MGPIHKRVMAAKTVFMILNIVDHGLP